ncbi:hypothetical protein KKC97_14320, partial [bacterium]|nr:hypothetical protein [bacterium]
MNCKLCRFFILISLLLVASAEISAQENLNIECINQFYHNWTDGVIDIAVQGDYAYLACQSDGFRIVNISDIHSPFDVSHIAFSYVTTVAVQGNYAYFGGYSIDGIQVVDVSDPANPFIAGTILAETEAIEILIRGNRMYAASSEYDYSVVDISDPPHPIVLCNAPRNYGADALDLVNDKLYLAAQYDGVIAIDISVLDQPVVLGSYQSSVGDWVNGVSVKDGYAYIACGWSGMEVIDLSTMLRVASIDSLVYAFGTQIVNGMLYMNYGDPDCPLAIIDIQDPLHPQTLGVYYPPEDLWNFTVIGNTAYIADDSHGFRMVNVADPTNPVEIARHNRYGENLEVQVIGDLAYVRETIDFTIFDVSDPLHPQELGFYESRWGFNDFDIVGNIAYCVGTGYECLFALDISDPTAPQLLASYTSEDSDVHYRFVIHDHYLYLVENDGLRIFDIADPAQFVEVGFFEMYIGNARLYCDNRYIYLREFYRHVHVIDIADPANPTLAGTWDIENYCSAITSRDDLIFVTIGSVVNVYDRTNLTNPGPVEVIHLPDGYPTSFSSIEARDNYLYLTSSEYGIIVCDISDITAPQVIGSYGTPGSACNMHLVDNSIYVADHSNLGIYSFTPTTPASPIGPDAVASTFTLFSNYPNPFNSTTQIRFEVAGNYYISLAVFDMLGRQVTTLADQNFTTGTHVIP